MGANSRDFLDMRELEETADTTPTNLTLNKALLNTRVQQIKQEVDEAIHNLCRKFPCSQLIGFYLYNKDKLLRNIFQFVRLLGLS